MNKNQIRKSYMLFVLAFVIYLAGCTDQIPVLTPPLEEATAALVATITIPPNHTPTSQPTLSFSPEPTLSSTPKPTLTPMVTYPPYSDTSFTVAFLKKGNLWLSEIGGSGERQLTYEPSDWPVYEYDVSPTCNRIAYTVYEGPSTIDTIVKQVDIESGSVTVLTGENDPYSEVNLKWLDDTHIAFQLQDGVVSGHTADPLIVDTVITPFNHIVVDLVTGERVVVPESMLLSQSPNGHYWLTCAKPNPYWEGGCVYKLHDRVTNKQWQILKDLYWVGFEGWSPNSQFLTFWVMSGNSPTDVTDQLKVVNPATKEERLITSEKVTNVFGIWSPDSQTIVFSRCPKEKGATSPECTLWLMNTDGNNLREFPLRISGGTGYIGWSTENGDTGIDIINWTPDGSRLVFARLGTELNLYDIWSVRIDGTDLRPIVRDVDAHAKGAQVVCQK